MLTQQVKDPGPWLAVFGGITIITHGLLLEEMSEAYWVSAGVSCGALCCPIPGVLSQAPGPLFLVNSLSEAYYSSSASHPLGWQP